MKFIGDLSKKDVQVLTMYCMDKEVLEFGAGGSTMVLGQCAKRFETVETDLKWINKTVKHINDLEIKQPSKYHTYNQFKPSRKYDVIFVDGLYKLRLEFALKTWRHLKDGGVIIFHDTRRSKDKMAVGLFLSYVQKTLNDKTFTVWNVLKSNMTVIEKNIRHGEARSLIDLHYENWNKAEEKPQWMIDGNNKPEKWINLLPEI